MIRKKILGIFAVAALIATVSVGGIYKNISATTGDVSLTQEYTDYDLTYEDIDAEFTSIESEEDLKALKDEFMQEYGSEDVFKKVYEDDEYLEEVNGAKGIFRYTDKATNEVEEYNYFKELERELELSKLSADEQVKYLKDEFTQEYGSEDVFKKVYEDDEYLEEVNGAKGIFRYTDKATNEVEEYNYFKELERELELSKLSADEQVKYLKDEFTQEYGSEDVFKKVYEDDEYLEEVNGAKGIFRYTDKTTNEVEEYNYFDELLNDFTNDTTDTTSNSI